MCKAETDLEKMQLTQVEKPDPATQQRQQHLFGQAEQYAGGLSPFQQEYGYGRQMVPSLSGMSQTGQQYLADKVLGKGAYGYQSLGFQDYRRPELAPQGGYEYGQSGYKAGDIFKEGQTESKRQKKYLDDPSSWFIDNPDAVEPEGWAGMTPKEQRAWLRAQGTVLGSEQQTQQAAQVAGAAPVLSTAQQQQRGPTPAGTIGQRGEVQTETAQAGSAAYPSPWDPWGPGYREGLNPPIDQNIWNVQGRDTLEGTRPEAAYYNQPSFGLQNVPTATSRDEYIARTGGLRGGGLLQTDLGRPTAGVGIGEIEDARTATRRLLLEQGRAGDPAYDQFLPGGWTGLGEAGTGTAAGDPSIARLGEEAVPDPTLIGTDFGVAAPTDITGIPGIAAQDIADVGEGYAGDAVTAGGLAGTEPNVRVDPLTGAVTQDVLGVAPTPIAAPGEVTVDPVTGEITQAVADVTPGAIAGPGGVTVDPITGQVTQAVADVDPTAFTGASFLGGDLGAYMDVGGVGAQVTAAQQAYEQAQNVEQARRAQSLAWGTRGDIPRAEQERQMLAQIADIRRKGYTDAADRMEADLQRQQAAGMQTQQLTAQTGMQAQQLEAQRRESDAARAQQALIQGQQLGTQADLQYQQLAQQGGIRGAELGLQAQMQGQQLEAQRRSEDAARAQQAALSGQQLGTQAELQTQQLGQAGDIRAAELDAQIGLAGQQLQAQRREADAARSQQAAIQAQQLDTEARLQEQRLGTERTQRKAELDLQAALANQQAALQSGNQTQQLEAQQAIRQAELDLEQQRATTGVGADVAMQRQQLEVQAQIQTAQNQLEAARADQQAAFQSGNAQAQYEAQRQMREAELRLQRGMQTQQLGAGAAAQQTQLEFARRQELAGMGLQAQGMGMDDAARFRAQQMQAAQQLAGLGGMEQAATFGAAEQLAQMGMTQEQRQQMQAAADYEQWLRSQEGFADEAAFLQAMQPTPDQMQYQRKPSVWGQVAGGLLSAGGAAATAFGSDVRIKDNIEYVGMENGFKTYEFNYLGRDNRYRGVMAQEVMLERPDAVDMQDGFYRVNYDAIGVEFEAV